MDTNLSIKPGFSTEVSPLTAALLAADSGDIGIGLRNLGNYIPDIRKISLDRYFDPAFAALEKEHLWKKVWQFACREEDIPNVGDRVPYTVGDLSYVIVRSAPEEFKAFYNSCLHRGTRLCNAPGSGKSLRCPFHAWQWDLDGSLRSIPSRWDFPHVKAEDYQLPEVKLGTWGGFIFINPDPDAGPLEETLGMLPEYFKDCPAEDRFTAFHVRKKVRANWKTTMEAFLESYHVVETHADSLSFTGDASTQYDIWENGISHISRLITPLGIPSPHLGNHGDARHRGAEIRSQFAAFAARANRDMAAGTHGRRLGPRYVSLAGHNLAGQHSILFISKFLPVVWRRAAADLPVPAVRHRPERIDHGSASHSTASWRRRAATLGADYRTGF